MKGRDGGQSFFHERESRQSPGQLFNFCSRNTPQHQPRTIIMELTTISRVTGHQRWKFDQKRILVIPSHVYLTPVPCRCLDAFPHENTSPIAGTGRRTDCLFRPRSSHSEKRKAASITRSTAVTGIYMYCTSSPNPPHVNKKIHTVLHFWLASLCQISLVPEIHDPDAAGRRYGIKGWKPKGSNNATIPKTTGSAPRRKGKGKGRC